MFVVSTSTSPSLPWVATITAMLLVYISTFAPVADFGVVSVCAHALPYPVAARNPDPAQGSMRAAL